MRGIWQGSRGDGTFNWVADVPFGITYSKYPYAQARDAKDGIAASEGCLFTLNGVRCGIGDLRAGDKIEIDGRPAVSVKATRTVSQ